MADEEIDGAVRDAPGVPPRFRVATSAFSTRTRGFVLGTARCSHGRCDVLLTTGDGGATWHQRSLPAKHIRYRLAPHLHVVQGQGPLAAADVFLTNSKWIFASHDGADSWARVRLPSAGTGVRVGPIATTSARIYAIIGDGTLDDGRTRLFQGEVDARSLRPAAGVEVAGNGVAVDGGWDVVASGADVAVALGRIFVSSAYWTSHDGASFTESDPPCTSEQVTSLGSVSSSRVDALCSYNPGMGHMFKDLEVSTDGGPFEPAGTVPDAGLTEEYVATAPGENTITAVSGASILYRSNGQSWQTPMFISEALPFQDLHFIDARHGFVTWGGPTWSDSGIYRTNDGGHTWEPLDIGSTAPPHSTAG